MIEHTNKIKRVNSENNLSQGSNKIKRSTSENDLSASNNDHVYTQEFVNTIMSRNKSDLENKGVENKVALENLEKQLMKGIFELNRKMEDISELNRKMKSNLFLTKALFGTAGLVALSAIAYSTVQAIGTIVGGLSTAWAAIAIAAPYIGIVSAVLVVAGVIGLSAYKVYQHKTEIKETVGKIANKAKDGVVYAAHRTKDDVVHVVHKTKGGVKHVANKTKDLAKSAQQQATDVKNNAFAKGGDFLYSHGDKKVKHAMQDILKRGSPDPKNEAVNITKQLKDIFESNNTKHDKDKLINTILSTVKKEISSQISTSFLEWKDQAPKNRSEISDPHKNNENSRKIENKILDLDKQKILISNIYTNQSLEKLITQTTELGFSEQNTLNKLNEVFVKQHKLFTETIEKCKAQQTLEKAAKTEAKHGPKFDLIPKFRLPFSSKRRNTAHLSSSGHTMNAQFYVDDECTPLLLDQESETPQSLFSRSTSMSSVNSFFSCVGDRDTLTSQHNHIQHRSEPQITHESAPGTPSADSGVGVSRSPSSNKLSELRHPQSHINKVKVEHAVEDNIIINI